VLEFGPIELAECQANQPASATLEDYQQAMAFAVAVCRHCHWWVGDMMLELERRFGDLSTQALPMDSISLDQLNRIKAVSRRVPKANRRADLSWYHHQQVSRLPKHLQQNWLEKAALEGWSSNEFRVQVSKFLSS